MIGAELPQLYDMQNKKRKKFYYLQITKAIPHRKVGAILPEVI